MCLAGYRPGLRNLWCLVISSMLSTDKTLKIGHNNPSTYNINVQAVHTWLLEALNNCLLDIYVQFNWSLMKTEEVDRCFHQIVPNFDKFGRKRVKTEKFKIPASRRPA